LRAGPSLCSAHNTNGGTMLNKENFPFLKSVKEAGIIFGLSYNKMKMFVNDRDTNGLNEHVYQFKTTKPNCKIYLDVNGFADWIYKRKATNKTANTT
jgi:hypothetical protein